MHIYQRVYPGPLFKECIQGHCLSVYRAIVENAAGVYKASVQNVFVCIYK